MKALFINMVNIQRDKAVLKIFTQGANIGHYHKLTFKSYDAAREFILKQVKPNRRLILHDTLTGYKWLYFQGEKKEITTEQSNRIYLKGQ